MPRVSVRFFGPARDLTGEEEVTLTLEDGQTVGAVAGILSENYPRLGSSLGIRLAVNRAYVALDHVLTEGDEVAVIPPVSGGADPPRVSLTRDPIDIATLSDALRTDEAGAMTIFAGTVRIEESEGKTLTALAYHAYEEMALQQMAAIRRRAGEKFDILDTAIVHRLGRLGLGEVSIAVVVLSAHRAAGFEASRWIVDTIKRDVPIWKKDIWADGSASWVEPT